MADNVRLYMFECGTLQCHVENIKMNQGLGDEYEIPVPWFLITHPKGNVVIDGGNAAECATDPAGHWGATSDVYFPRMTPEQACVPALRNAGFDPADVAFILQSHLHLDHTGALAALEDFPNAQVVATRTEYEYSRAPDWFAAGGYIRADFDKPGVPWALLDDTDDGYDLYGDGVIRMWRSPGHAPGHQSFEITLPNTGSVLLTVDAAYTTDHWEEKALPGFLTSAVESARSVRKLRRIADRSGSTVVTGHDPVAWPGFRQAPGFYD
ncbi:MAG: N-acyl homoserine lactone hydrolase [Solirubrobacteraceae bacterium]|nr:N-acyl homoserine lactone hydrolase [Solirubrobacteraceae bacterium]